MNAVASPVQGVARRVRSALMIGGLSPERLIVHDPARTL